MIVMVVFAAYGALLYAESIVGYLKSRRQWPLVAGIVSGTILMSAAWMLQRGIQGGASIGLGATAAMLGNFSSRYRKTKDFVPSGFMMVISALAVAIVASQVFRH